MDLKDIIRTSPKYLSILKDAWLDSVRAFLLYFPRDYEDRATVSPLSSFDAWASGTMTTIAKVTGKKTIRAWSRTIHEVHFVDENNDPWVMTFFGNAYVIKWLLKDKAYIITGKPKLNYGKITFSHPERAPLDQANNHNFGRIYPIYPELYTIKSSWFAKNMRKGKDHISKIFHEYLPQEFLDQFWLLSVPDMISQLHFPDSFALLDRAKYRLFFDRMLRIQLHAFLNKQDYSSSFVAQKKPTDIDRSILTPLTDKLPFQLTWAQKRVLVESINDISYSKEPMMRLLQWDVWSGKTIVAALIAYFVIKQYGGQVVFLAPLAILAHQHHKNIAKLLLPLGIRVELLTWSVTKKQKDKIKKDLTAWLVHVVVWTTALLQEDVNFHDLALAIVDEQHKFWVRQRSFFKKFGSPHLLQMSATPIPRSMALAFFGEFSVSTIDELPAGRKPIYSKVISEKERYKLKPWILDKVWQWQKVYIIAPLVSESERETMQDVKNVQDEFFITQDWIPELKHKIWLMHGKMKQKEKDDVMHAFKEGKISLLVATTVIEVWVDVPEATIMIIRNAERFGLSQLHQLRGRIGRSDLQSYCFLETQKKSWDSYTRLKALEETTDGFKLAELDLQYRGAWEILWTKQSWQTDIPLELLSDLDFVQQVRKWALWLLKKYPKLEWLPGLQKFLDEKIGDVMA